MVNHTEDKDTLESKSTQSYDPNVHDCDNISDPVRRTLCKACGMPVVGEAPFCKDHEPPVP
jgi:hypothetical protein